MLSKLDEYNKVLDNLKSDKKNSINLQGVQRGMSEHLVFSLVKDGFKNNLIITESEVHAKEVSNNLKAFTDQEVLYYPEKDILFYSSLVRSNDIMVERLKVYNSLFENNGSIIVTSIDGLFDRLSPREFLENSIIKLNVGDEYDQEKLIQKLISLGYKRCEEVESGGQFAVRGGIVDVFTLMDNLAVRLEFFGDEIDSIRILDEYGKRSIENVTSFEILPVHELLFDGKSLTQSVKKLTKEYEDGLEYFKSRGLHEEEENLKKTYQESIFDLNERGHCKNMEVLLPYFYDEKICLIDYLTDDFVVHFFDIERIKNVADIRTKEYYDSFNSRKLRGYMLNTASDLVNTFDEIVQKSKRFNCLLVNNLLGANQKYFKTVCTVDFESASILDAAGNINTFIDNTEHFLKLGYTVIIKAGSRTRSLMLSNELEANGIHATYTDTIDNIDYKPYVYLTKGVLSNSFYYKSVKVAFLSDNKLFEQSKRKRKKYNGSERLKDYSELKVGDYVVHINHGIGIFKGIEKINSNGVIRDYIKIGFADNGNIYVNTNQLDTVQKYIGKEAKNIKLNKLGTKDWENTKARTKKVVEVLAKDLLELYAKREATRGYEFSKDNVWQKEFEDLFQFNETEDQIIAIEDVKYDMEKPKVMDRLICGDVGYGKTEVAIRAAFKAVQDSKQVVYLCPTTILAQQHYETFKQRMKDFPVNIELLSRFRTKKQQTESLANIESGKSEILIGTHRVLSKDVNFNDLGLVIVDEEQRFGVTHKEKLKKLSENVDVLTLSATPIPRTLHMSMTGIRDMSVLSTPPFERVPIQTYVLEHNEEDVKEAIKRELSRNGQVFYLYNRVRGIELVTEKLRELLPNARIDVAHGQMGERQLENVMNDFINHEFDVLVCTTIIETGLDISNANTIIIDNADAMGLSQLYQLRGRVGRSNRSAYAYLLYKRDKVLSEVAEKRLQTIKDFTEFGSGFKVAMRDLEIRGAGSLLGEQQSGHLETVGYELYCKLLDDAVRQLKGEEIAKEIDMTVDLDISAYIPPTYISDEVQKIQMYKKIADIRTTADYYDVSDELIDRFSDIPKEVQLLLDITMFKVKCDSLGIMSVVQKGQLVHITASNDCKLSFEKITEYTKLNYGKVRLQLDEDKTVIIFKLDDEYTKKNYDILKEVDDFIEEIKEQKEIKEISIVE